ncbi:GNAT family N-acetyltransferase [Devosia aurantiaca]|uniref:GNAT family N-acetyltransferase n=1 Tax=Devosia aurantiaca TaxID=2714858 RepID=A0A6M1SHJ8_9HYPH|nr:GNAT family N-acetyltransferase [Devosia aurantiaca]NGP16640.1 GNAT family N-acetyltransferase [Devosia aurantiaca]
MTTETALAAAPARSLRPASAAGRLAFGAVPVADWASLVETAIEANAFFDPAYALPVARFTRGGDATKALCAFDDKQLSGLVPVRSAWQVYRLPIPALVSHQPYTVLGSPLLSNEDAATALLDNAARSGAHLLVLHMADLDGPAMIAMRASAKRRSLAITVQDEHERAALRVPEDAEAYLRAGMGAKKLKELRRLRHRLDEEGEVVFTVARDEATILPALERFLTLEAAGWKGERGTGLAQNQGDTRYITEVALGLAPKSGIEIVELSVAGKTIAAGLVLRQQRTAMFFKIAFDEAYARYSPGVQLTVELTRHFTENPAIDFVDSCALPGHPMIDHVWRERRRVGNVLIATRPGPVAALCARLILLRGEARETAKSLLHRTRNALKTREIRK